jgi:hypothetical protein
MKSTLRLSRLFAGFTANKIQAPQKVSLQNAETYRLRNRGQQVALEGVKGAVYVTVENDTRDYILQPGERLMIDKPGLVVAQGMPEGAFRII